MTDPVPPPPYQPPSGEPGFAPPPGPPPAPTGASAAYSGAPPPGTGRPGTAGKTGLAGMVADPSTLAATGLIAAVLFAIGAGLIGFLGNPGRLLGFRGRLLALTDTVDVGDVALLGIAVVLLLLTPDPPGGIARRVLLLATAALSGIISAYAVIRALVLLSATSDIFANRTNLALRLSGFLATVGVGIAAATVGFYAAKESFLKKDGRI